MDKKFVTNEIFRINKIIPNEKLGQHFIVNRKYLNLMADGIDKDTIVIEIGSGFGQLTEALTIKAKRVIAIEIDKRFKRSLYDLAKKYKKLELIFDDALKVPFDKLIDKKLIRRGRVMVIANLPYHITEPLFNKMLHYPNIKMRLMVGKKFGYQAQTKNSEDLHFTSLSFLIRSFYDVNQICEIPKSAFNPQPKTDSMILDFLPKKMNLDDKVDFLCRGLFLFQKYGTQVKNALMNNIISRSRMLDETLTKNMARDIVRNLNIPEEILQKPFSQLSNDEIRILSSKLDKMN